MNPFEAVGKYYSALELAEKVGLDPDEALRMGILCAQLGLTEGDLEPMARSYLMLKEVDVSISALRQLSRALNAATGSTEPTNY